MEANRCVFGRYLNFLTKRRRTHGTHCKHTNHDPKRGHDSKAQKCYFLQQRVDYLGHIVSPGKLEVASKTVEAVQKVRPSHDVSSVRSFLGICNVYRRFMPNFARIEVTLTKNLKKEETDKWDSLNEVETTAFEDLKERFTEPPVLSLPQMNLAYIVNTDAYHSQIG